MSRPEPLLVRRQESAPCLLPAPHSLSPTAVGTATPGPGHGGPGTGSLDWLSGPTAAELVVIDAEWPVIEAEVALVDAECRHLLHPTVATRAAIRMAEAGVIRAHLRHLHPTSLLAPSSPGDLT